MKVAFVVPNDWSSKYGGGAEYQSYLFISKLNRSTNFNTFYICRDVRKLDFLYNYFAGYWSIGVIEHLSSGYDDIAKEMSRVIKPGGYLFLSFPYMSYLRRLKSKSRMYIEFLNQTHHNFYQFALNAIPVIHYFERLGFILINFTDA